MKSYFRNGLIFISLFCGFAFAGTGEITVKEVRVEGGMVYVFPNESVENEKSCGASSPIKLEYADLGFEEMYSQALVAYSSGSKIKFWLRSCEASPWGHTVPKAYATGLVK